MCMLSPRKIVTLRRLLNPDNLVAYNVLDKHSSASDRDIYLHIYVDVGMTYVYAFRRSTI